MSVQCILHFFDIYIYIHTHTYLGISAVICHLVQKIFVFCCMILLLVQNNRENCEAGFSVFS
jgi:hypothetical protein